MREAAPPGMTLLMPGMPAPEQLRGGVIAIGNFDGVHRGHQVLLAAARQAAAARDRAWGALTFEPHPRSFFRPAEPVFRLSPLPLKARLIAGLGADFLAVTAFDAALAGLSPEAFVQAELATRLGVSHVITGYDFHFGKGRKGNPETMRQLGAVHGFTISVIDQVTDDGGIAPYASSAIRDALRHGRVRDAAHGLGRPWTVMGEVVEGDKRGRTIGFPTLNIVLEPGAEPLQGIYAVRVRRAGGSGTWPGAGYFGKRPTFDTDRSFLEVFLLDFSGTLYGETLLVEFIELIRPDRKFDTVAGLQAQMNEDCAAARRILADW